MKRYKIQIHDQEFDITVSPEGEDYVISVGGRDRHVSISDISKTRYHLLIDSLSREVDLRRDDGGWAVFMDGNQYSASVVDYHLAELKKTAGVSHVSHMSRELRSPMPGLILNLAVKPGDSVKKGDTLLALEAMKMENLIKATGEGIVKRIAVESGSSVEKGETLIEFE